MVPLISFVLTNLIQTIVCCVVAGHEVEAVLARLQRHAAKYFAIHELEKRLTATKSSLAEALVRRREQVRQLFCTSTNLQLGSSGT